MDDSAPPNHDPLADLFKRYPNMRRVENVPWLATFNGFGFTVYGHRDEDYETGTYVKSHCFCALFIPLFFFGAYRVSDAEGGGWYFFGKLPLSGITKAWNGLVAAAIILGGALIGWTSHTSSPEYKAKQDLITADKHLKAGEPAKAAGFYRRHLEMPSVATQAREGLRASLEQCLSSDNVATVGTGLRLTAGLPARANKPDALVPDAFKRGLSLVEKFRAEDPESGLRIFEDAAVLDPKNEALKPLRLDLLKQTVTTHPDNTNRVVELALIYEKEGPPGESVKLLTPYAKKLGATEGARILGQHFLKEGQYEDSYGLLFPYVQVRLQKLHAVERSYTNAIARASERAVDDLRHNRGPSDFYARYDRASKTEKQEMVDDYIQKAMQVDANYRRAVEELRSANEIVNVTLDLGIVQLNRAQTLTDAGARQAELQAAEKTFLAIRGFAGESDEYKLFLGQVSYWLGKSKEGKELFDQLLASKKRSWAILLALSRTLRDVGEHQQAREMTEEAYRTGKAGKEKFDAAALRAHIQKDTDDMIAWLRLSDTNEASVKIALNDAQGMKALQQGNKTQAAAFLREADQAYRGLPKSSVTLNNWGIAVLNLYEANGKAEDYTRGLALLEEAVALSPSDSITLMNTMHILFGRAILDTVRDSIRTDLLGEAPNAGHLSHLYNDEAGFRRIFSQLRTAESMKKGLNYLDRALLLAPKRVHLYSQGLQWRVSFEELAELQKLQQRFVAAQIDFTAHRKELREFYTGAKDKEYLGKYRESIARCEKLLATPAVQAHPPTLAVVSSTLGNIRQNAWVVGEPVDSGKLLADALATHRAQPSMATRSALIAAHFFRAHDELNRERTDYKAMVTHTRRALGPQHLITLLLERGGPLADAIRADPNVQAAAALQKERGRLMPSFRHPTEWALLRTLDPAEAAAIAATYKTNAISLLVDELQFQFDAASPAETLDAYWMKQLLGDATGAAALYDQALRDGMPLPVK
jgi:tetratricopeptide (TPR) repeat protein